MATTEKRFVVTGDQAIRLGKVETELKRQLYSQHDTKLNPEGVIATYQGMTEGKLTPFAGGLRGKFLRSMMVIIGGVEKLDLPDLVKAVRELDSYAESMILYEKFTTLAEPEAVLQIELSPADQGFTEPPTWKEFACNKRLAEWSRAVFEGYIVELNPAEVGPHMAIQYTGQPNGEVIWIAMETVPDSHGFPGVFAVARDGGGGLWLHGDWIDPGRRIDLGRRFSFRLRKVA